MASASAGDAGLPTQPQVFKPNSLEKADELLKLAKQLPATFAGRPLAFVPMTAAPSTLKGDLSDPAWEKAVTLKMVSTKNGDSALYDSQIKVLCTSDAIYFGFKFADPAPDQLVVECPEICKNDAIELFLFPGESAKKKNYYQVALDAGNRTQSWFTHLYVKKGWVGESNNWPARFDHDVARGKDGWTAELKIRYADMVFQPEALENKSLWRFDVFRSRPTRGDVEEQRYAWAPTMDRDYHFAGRFGYIMPAALASEALIDDVLNRSKLENAPPKADPGAESQVKTLIEKLGDDQYSVRNATHAELEKLALSNAALLPMLKARFADAVASSSDAEIRSQCRKLIRFVDDQLEDDPLPVNYIRPKGDE